MRNFIVLLSLVILTWCSPVFAKPQCTLTHYDEFNGLTQWWVTQIIQDRQGMIWISTWNGLNRYDGYEFVCFKSRAGDGVDIPSDRIDDIVLAEDGSLRCNIDNRVFGFCPQTCKYYELGKKEEARFVRMFKEKHKYELFLENSGAPQQFSDKNGTEWLVYRDGGLKYKDPFTRQYMSYQVDWHGASKIYFCMLDTEGNAWFTSSYGVFKLTFEKKAFQLFEQEIPMQVRSFYVDKKNRYWITTRDDATVRIYDGSNRLLGYLGPDGKLHSYYTSFGSPVYHIMQDSRGVFWLSSKPGGLYRLSETGDGCFTVDHFMHRDDDTYSISNDELYHTIEDKLGRIWVATFETGLNCIEKPQEKELRFLNENNSLKYPKNVAQRVRHIYITEHNQLIAATTTGLVVADISLSNPRDITFKCHRKDIRRSNSLSNNAVMYVAEDAAHHIYVCTESGGLNLITSEDILGNELEFKHYNALTGFPSDVTLSVLPINDYLLVVCRNRIVKLYTSGKYKGKIEPFFTNDYLRFSDACPVRLPDGRMIFGLQNGAFTVALEDLCVNKYVPPIVLTGLSVGDQELQRSVAMMDTLVLLPGNRTFTIHYAALGYSNNDHINYAFRMEKDGKWNDVGVNRTTSFYDLRPGEYHLYIRSTNSDGVWMDNERLLTIIVKPTFWETWWANLVYFMGILLFIAIGSYLLFTFYKLRQKMSIEQQISDVKLKFFTNVSHELRTPLTLIHGFVSEIAQEKDLGQNLRTQMAVVSDNVNRMLRLVNQILDVYKLESDRMKLCVQKVDLIPFVQHIMGYFDNMAASHQIDFCFESSMASLNMWADGDKLDKILFNLIGNAFKYTPKNKKIMVRVEAEGDNVIIRVEDQGVGINNESLKNLFDEFSNSKSRNLFNMPSSGLGLSFVKKLVDLHDGTITVSSQEGVGSKFIITLPRDREHFKGKDVEFILNDDAQQPLEANCLLRQNSTTTDAEEKVANGKMTILVVEDNDQMRFLLRSILSDKYHIIEASNGEIGLDSAREYMPDIIISDIMMPVMNGMEMLSHVRQDKVLSHIPVIMLTAKSDDESVINSIREGVDSYIVKPFNSELLKARIENLFEQRTRLQAYYQRKLMTIPAVSPETDEQSCKITVNDEFLDRLTQVVADHLADGDYSIEQMACEMNMSRSVLFKKLKAVTGMSPIEYLKAFRMKHAAQLLQTTTHSVTEVTYMVGINDPHYFSNCFKKQYGVSPTEFRDKQRRYE